MVHKLLMLFLVWSCVVDYGCVAETVTCFSCHYFAGESNSVSLEAKLATLNQGDVVDKRCIEHGEDFAKDPVTTTCTASGGAIPVCTKAQLHFNVYDGLLGVMSVRGVVRGCDTRTASDNVTCSAGVTDSGAYGQYVSALFVREMRADICACSTDQCNAAPPHTTGHSLVTTLASLLTAALINVMGMDV